MTELTLETVAEWNREHEAFRTHPAGAVPIPIEDAFAEVCHRRNADDRYAALLAFARERLTKEAAAPTGGVRVLYDKRTGKTRVLLTTGTEVQWAAEPPTSAAEPPDEVLCEWCHLPMGPPPMGPWILGCNCPKAPPAVALGAEAAFYAGRTLEAEADAADWKLKAEAAEREVARLRGIETVMKAVNDNHRAACVSIALYEAEVAALRADLAHIATSRVWLDENGYWCVDRSTARYSSLNDALAAARQSPASAPQPDVWYRSTIRPSSIPYLTRSIREIDEP